MSKTEGRVGLRQIAQKAGVSLSTVSNVLTEKPGVAISAETRKAVLAAAAELGYQPRSRPETGRVSQITTLGVVLRKPLPLLTNPYYGHIFHGIQEACEELGIGLMYGRVDETASSVDDLPSMIQRKQVQGLLVLGYFAESFFHLLQRLEQPFVLVDHLLEHLQLDSITCDDERGAYLATKYLIEHGHTHPAIIAGPLVHFSIQARFAGYRRALAEYSLHYEKSAVRYGDLSMDSGHNEMLALLEKSGLPTAVFCCNDGMAMGAINALQQRGLNVPDDCSIIGFDDVQLSPYTTPPLTTIKVEKEWMGMQSVWQLIERITHPKMPARHLSIGVSLIERQSVKSRQTTSALEYEKNPPSV